MINNSYFKDQHENNLPTVRIKKAKLENFKSVAKGEIEFNCGKQHIPYGTSSDILGIYGQNGSGKTSFIEALAILKRLLMGARVPDEYAECVSKNAEYAHLEFSFDLQYPSGEIREAVYSFCMSHAALNEDEYQERFKGAPDDFDIPQDVEKVIIFNEKLRLSWNEDGKDRILQDIIDTSTIKIPFGPAPKLKAFIGNASEQLLELEVSKRLAKEKSQSFIFRNGTIKIFDECDLYSVFYQVILELRYFASLYFFVIDTKSTGFIRLNFAIPIYTRFSRFTFDAHNSVQMSDEELEATTKQIQGISMVLNQIVPGLTIEFKKLSSEKSDDGNSKNSVVLIAKRGNQELPLRDESDGVRKIISVLSLITSAYNDRSCTVAIDEFDAGIFEYLLGEILEIFEESGKGQFIFTSHNLRPLEVIDKKFLYFTTSNPNNRFVKLKNIGNTNNLRDTYFREIVVGEQDEEVYNKTKRHKIVASLMKAGAWEVDTYGKKAKI